MTYDLSTLEGQFKFLRDFPQWSPVLDNEARVIYLSCAGYYLQTVESKEE